ncbi:alpha-ketoglutarate dependent xanthine dioxygenase [Colletotrichum tofieldiae]|nr:alpha-ketoglutarate dependent xanthine dioxygenase [Colletotrichum tofieldiae]
MPEEEDLQRLKRIVWDHKFVIIKGQRLLQPAKQWELVTRLDPEAGPQSPDIFMQDFHPDGEGILVRVPGVENVHIIGKGYQGKDHYGLKDLNLDKSFSYENHHPTLPPDELENGHTRFQGWHFDAPLYNRDPPLFTAFRVIRLPKGPDITIQWDDGSGLSMKSAPGLTPFFCCSQLYEELMTEEERQIADNSWVEYAAFPYEWNRNCKFFPTGLGIISQSKELSEDALKEMRPDEAKVRRVQANAAKRLFIRSGPHEEPKVVDDVAEVRRFLLHIQSRILKPEYILIPPEEEGDLLLWDNWATMHSRVDYPARYGPKTCHQAGTNASRRPVGPVAAPVF